MTADRPLSPGRIGPDFLALSSDVTWLYAKWVTFKELFNHSQERIDLLNATASNFFYITEQALLDAVQLEISRLLDSVKIRGRENLVLESLLLGLNPELDWDRDLLSKLHPRLSALKELEQPVRESRNRRIAHRDKGVALRAEEALPGISVELIDRLLAECAEILNSYKQHWIDSRTEFADVVLPTGANAIVHAAVRARDHRACLAKTPPKP